MGDTLLKVMASLCESCIVGELGNKGVIWDIIDSGCAVRSPLLKGDKDEGGGKDEEEGRKHLLTLVILMSSDSEIRLVFFRLSAEAGMKVPPLIILTLSKMPFPCCKGGVFSLERASLGLQVSAW